MGSFLHLAWVVSSVPKTIKVFLILVSEKSILHTPSYLASENKTGEFCNHQFSTDGKNAWEGEGEGEWERKREAKFTSFQPTAKMHSPLLTFPRFRTCEVIRIPVLLANILVKFPTQCFA